MNSNSKLINNVNSNRNDMTNIKENISKLNSVYESKINQLKNKIEENENIIKENNSNILIKDQQINYLNQLVKEEKNKNKTLLNQYEIKNNELYNLKIECEKIISSKDIKINQLKNIVNQSIYSFNKGIDNINIAKKLDDEVKILIQTAKKNNGND